MELTAFDLHHAAKELQRMEGAKVEKIFQSKTDRKDILFQMYLQEWPKIYLRFVLPGMICLEGEKPAYPQQPGAFAMFLRKYLSGARLAKVEQRGFDRILVLSFDAKEGPVDVIAELMPPGNLLLVMDGKIKSLVKPESFKDRTLRGGIPYDAPPSPFDLLHASQDEIAEQIIASTKDSIVVTLAVSLGLGGIYAEEACARAGIGKQRADLPKKEALAIAASIREMLECSITPHADEKRAYPFEMKTKDSSPTEENLFLKSLSRFTQPPPDGEVQKEGSKAARIEKMIAAQEKRMHELEQQIADNQMKGELIFKNYQTVQQILHDSKEGDVDSHPEVIARENGKITVELDER